MAYPFDGIIRVKDFEKWLDQFDESDREIIHKLLPYYQYFSSEKVFELLNLLYKKLVDDFNIKTETTVFVPVGYIAKSGAAISYFFRRENDLPEENFIALNDLTPEVFHRVKNIVFLDDFIGTGNYLESIKKDFVQKLSQPISERINFIFACVVGYQQGIEKISDENFKGCVAQLITYNDQPLHPNSNIFSDSEKTTISNVLLKYNMKIHPKRPYGYGDLQGLVSFFFATPNNTLPIFWASEHGWYPLFPRGDSRRNPNGLIVLPDFLNDHKIFSPEFNSHINSSEDISRELFNCFLSLDKMNIMSEVFHHLNIADKLIKPVISAIGNYQNLQHEKNPVCTSFLVINSKYKELVHNELVADAENLTIYNDRMFRKHLLIVEGWSNTLVMDNYGNVLGVLNYQKEASNVESKGANDKYIGFEYTSKLYHGLLVIFTNNDKVLLYYNGDRLMTKKGNDWHIQGSLKNLTEIAMSHDIDPQVLSRAMEIAFKLSDVGEGGILCIGDETNTNQYASPMGELQIQYRMNNILEADEKSLLSRVAQDGATVVAATGEIISTMVRLEPPKDVEIEAEVDKGTRHNTAKKMSKITNAVFIVVSSDGPISIYANGERLMRMLG